MYPATYQVSKHITPLFSGALSRASGVGPKARNVLQLLVKSRFTRWFSIQPAARMRTPKKPRTCSRSGTDTNHQPTRLTQNLRRTAPQLLAHCRTPVKSHYWLPDWMRSWMALAVNNSRDLNSEFSAKARAPNHQKTTGALAYNAVVQRQPWQSEAATRLSGGGPQGPKRTGTNCYALRANIRTNMATKRVKLRPFNAAKHTDLYFCGFFRNKSSSTAGHRK